MSRISYAEGYSDQSVLKQLWDDKVDIENLQLGIADYPIDAELSETSRFPVENQVVTAALQQRQPVGDYVTSVALDERLENYPTDQDIDLVEGNLQAQIDTKQTASLLIRRIHIGTAEVPDEALGEDGDLYIWRP